MSFINEYQSITKLIDPELKLLKTELVSEFEDYLDLKAYINTPSKHIRPVLGLLYLKAVNKEITPEIIKFLTVVELIHNASLIHDDVIDDGKIRRKNFTLNKQEGNHLAVIGGDYILSYALEKLTALNSIELFKIFSKSLKLMCKGEISQQESKFKIPTLEEYLEKTYQKTGALFEASIKGLIHLAQLEGATYNFGAEFGIAFQIRDDILNIKTQNPDSDVQNGIYTAPVIFSGDPNQAYLGIEKAKSLLDTYVVKVRKSFETLPENNYKSALIKLAEILKDE